MFSGFLFAISRSHSDQHHHTVGVVAVILLRVRLMTGWMGVTHLWRRFTVSAQFGCVCRRDGAKCL